MTTPTQCCSWRPFPALTSNSPKIPKSIGFRTPSSCGNLLSPRSCSLILLSLVSLPLCRIYWCQFFSDCECSRTVFMNKYDLLSRKIKHGAVIKEHLPSFGERDNTAKEFARCTCLTSFHYHSLPHCHFSDGMSICTVNPCLQTSDISSKASIATIHRSLGRFMRSLPRSSYVFSPDLRVRFLTISDGRNVQQDQKATATTLRYSAFILGYVSFLSVTD